MDGKAPKIIMVVDDDSHHRHNIESTLVRVKGPPEFRIMCAQNADVALYLIDSGHVPVGLVINVEMPGMNGIDLAREIAKRKIVVRVIFTRDNEDCNLSRRDLLTFSSDIIHKPFGQIEFERLAMRVFGEDDSLANAVSA